MTESTTTLTLSTKWMDKAACRGLNTNMFYPLPGEPSTPARAVCDICPVSVECLLHAIEAGEQHGIWGGTPVRKRRNPPLALSNLKKRIETLEIVRIKKLQREARRKKVLD